jgi:hypothetical protein
MTNAPEHDDCTYSSDYESGRTEKHGDEKENHSSAIEQALDQAGVTHPRGKNIEDVVKYREDDERQAGQIKEAPKLFRGSPRMSECQKKGYGREEGAEQSGRIVADANDAANGCEYGGHCQEEISTVSVQGSGESFEHHSLLRHTALSEGSSLDLRARAVPSRTSHLPTCCR